VLAQELLEALNKAQNESSLDPIAVWALSKYLQGTWKDGLVKNIRPFDLGKALSNFFVDLSQHRLPEMITKQTPETESILLKFFGATDGGLPHFWKQCAEIWNVALEPYPSYAKEVKKYIDLLLQSSLKVKTATAPVESTPVSPSSPVENNPPAPIQPVRVEKQPSHPASPHQEKTPKPPAQPPAPLVDSKSAVFPKSAFLILQGTRIIPLNQPVITIGRRLDNHVILEDPRVSRTHAQIKLINDRFVIFDTNSTGGTYVNGKRTDQSVLYPGDVISLAGVVFIYSQELPAKPGDVKIIELGSPFAADRPTAVIRKEDVKAATRPNAKDLPELPKTGPLPK
jgi:FHA domain